MHLKSEGFASCIYDPGDTFDLAAYCKEKSIPYAKIGNPVPLDVFSAYGLEFQRRFVPELEDKLVTSLQRCPEGFRVGLEDGQFALARKVVVAVGLTHYDYVPPVLQGLSEDLVSHSSRHKTVDRFRGREVVIVGAGASALDFAALLHQAGATVHVVARKPVIRFHDPPDNLEPSLLDRLRSPITGIGPGWKLFLCTNAPLVFRQMPVEFRLDKVRRILGPAPCWFTKELVVGKVQLIVGTAVEGVEANDGRVVLRLRDSSGQKKTISADHVLAATGYKVDLRRLAFLDSSIQSAIRSIERTPVLSSNFESSIPGLYFVGASAANTFGPLLRFAFGARFTARRISRHLARKTAWQRVLNEESSDIKAADHGELARR
jgi:thioredoxin reductase